MTLIPKANEDCWISDDDVRNVFAEIYELLDKDLMGIHLTRSEYRKDLIIGAFDKAKYDLLKRAKLRYERSIRLGSQMPTVSQREVQGQTGADPLAAPQKPKTMGEKVRAEFGI